MNTLSLNGAWLLNIPGLRQTGLNATVPGDLYNDLLTDGVIADPFWRDNEVAALQLMEHDFVYHRTFDVPGELLKSDRVLLRCEGLDTLATIEINGETAGAADNMHRTWEYDVKALLHEGENVIAVTFASPTKFIREANAARFVEGSSDAMEGFPQIRKAHCMFGWDWGPRLPDCGIWRDISIIGVDYARIRDVHIRQRHEEGKVTLSVSTHLTRYVSPADLRLRVTVTTPEGDAPKPRLFDTRSVAALDKWNRYWRNCRVMRELVQESRDLGEQLAYKLKNRADKEIEKQRADRMRDRKIALGIDEVNAMARYYRDYFSQPGNDLDIDHFEERWESVGFKMDYGESFVDEFTWDAFLKLDKLKEIIGQVCDVQQLGDAIYSEWRYITQVSNSHTEEETEWLLIALDRLIKIAF